MAKIKHIVGEVIHDSRGDATLQVAVETDGGKAGAAAIPAGKSVGTFEAKVVDPAKSVEIIKNQFLPLLQGKDPFDQAEIDAAMIKLDGTNDKNRLGANTMLGVSLAVSRAAAAEKGIELYQYIGELDHRKGFAVPIPMFNLINGGKHADNNLDMQEFMVVPDKVAGYHNQLSAGKLVFSTLGQILRGDGAFVPIGDEGGYAPNLDTNEIALDLLLQAIKQSGYKPWDEISLALDVAASSLPATFEVSTKRYIGLINDYPILSLEDPFGEEDWQNWAEFRSEMSKQNASNKKLLLIGDDLFVTNTERLKKGIELNAANAILVKLNQIGTLTETLQVVEQARQAGYVIIVSHRSGETLDDYIADFAVGIGAQFIKTGAPNDAHPERMTKYRRLLTIEDQLTANKNA
ncbi:MAG TPA: phosphopyruvate hydratase [Candidatus Saccharimonadales bacterium]|nr:phosphopyruvate hydratase [Candidatus Saccharimonadales bacterium]